MGAWRTAGLALAVALAAAMPADAAKTKAPSCAKAGSATVRSSDQVRVYRLLEDAGNDVVNDHLVACWRPTGRRMTLTTGYSSSGYDQAYANVRLSGPRVALAILRWSDACKYECDDLSLAGSASVEVFDIRSRKRVHQVPIPFPGQVSDVALTPGGSVAWIAGDRVQATDRGGTRTLDTGVATRPLDAEGSIVSWVRGGAEQFARLADGPPVTETAKGRARRSCAKKGSTTVRATPDARLFTVFTRDGVDHLYGCLRSVGRPVELAEATDDIDAETSFGDVRLSGRYAAWAETSTDVSCKAACPPGYDGTTETLKVYDLKRRRTARSVAAGVTGHALVLTDRGGAAWLSGNDLFVTDRAGTRRLDSGAIRAGSLRTETSIVSWVRDGVERFARLGPAR